MANLWADNWQLRQASASFKRVAIFLRGFRICIGINKIRYWLTTSQILSQVLDLLIVPNIAVFIGQWEGAIARRSVAIGCFSNNGTLCWVSRVICGGGGGREIGRTSWYQGSRTRRKAILNNLDFTMTQHWIILYRNKSTVFYRKHSNKKYLASAFLLHAQK